MENTIVWIKQIRLDTHSFMRALALCCVLSGAGCASLPNVGPLVEASNQLRSAVSTSGATVVAELRLMTDGAAKADELEKDWQARNKAFAGIAAYAGALQAIVDAGNQGAKSAEKIADSVKKLAEAAGVVMPGSPEAVGVVTDIGKYLSAQIALARAAKSLQQSMEAAQPAVERICKLISADIAKLESILTAACNLQKDSIYLDYKKRNDYRKEILAKMETFKLATTNTPAATVNILDEQVKIAQLFQASNDWNSEYIAKMRAVEDRRKAGHTLMKRAQQAANEWSEAHASLHRALKECRPVSVESLVQSSVEIQQLIKKVQAL